MTLDNMLVAVMAKVGNFNLIVERTERNDLVYTIRYYSAKDRFNKEIKADTPYKVLQSILNFN